MSEDRSRISATTAARLVAAQFPRFAGLALSPVEPQGWDNTTFRLGSRLKLRFPTAVRYAAQAVKEATWLPHLAAHLPVAVQTVVGLGAPTDEFPLPWTIQDWLPGEPASRAPLPDAPRFAREVAAALVALQGAPTEGAPAAGDHSFHRGGAIAVYDVKTRACLDALGGIVDRDGALAVWEAALAAPGAGAAVWVHGDVAPDNLLVRDGGLCAVIDFGCIAVGDPACDLVIAWTFLEGDAREAFRAAIPGDERLWARARGWALWKALLTLHVPNLPDRDARRKRQVIAELMEETWRARKDSNPQPPDP